MAIESDKALWSALVGAAGLSCAAVYFYRALRDASSKTTRPGTLDGPDGARRRRRRRILGMAIVAAISLLVLVGGNLIDPVARPRTFLTCWLMVAGLLLWLCLVALADIRQTLRRRADLHQAAETKLAAGLDPTGQGGPVVREEAPRWFEPSPRG